MKEFWHLLHRIKNYTKPGIKNFYYFPPSFIGQIHIYLLQFLARYEADFENGRFHEYFYPTQKLCIYS